MATDPFETYRGDGATAKASSAPLAGTRQQRIQRLQIGLFGLGGMVLMVGLANIVMDSAQQNQGTVPEEQAVTPTEDVPPPPPRDPLADAGVMPDLPADGAAATPTPTPAPQESAIAAPAQQQ